MAFVNDELNAFVSQYASQSAYLEEIASSAAHSDWKLSSSGQSVSRTELLEIYSRRAKHLEQYETEHAVGLRRDIESLCRALANASGDSVRISSLEGPTEYDLAAFINTADGVMLGCLKTIDRRRVSEERWNDVWGPRTSTNDGPMGPS